MFDTNIIPYFPLRILFDGDSWFIQNPITGVEHDLNQAAYWLLRLCDGQRTWSEIVSELGQIYQASNAHVIANSDSLLQTLIDDGVLWCRQQRMQYWRMPPPVAVLWDLTSRCNLSCQHCVVSASPSNKEELSLDTCLHIADEMASFGVRQLILSGGEPLIRRDFFKIAEHASSRGFSLQIATNGTLITEQGAKRLAAIKANAQISLDGATPEIHDGFRQVQGSWKRTIRGIKRLVAAGVPVMIATVVTKINITQIPELYSLAAELGAHTFRILPFIPYGRGGVARKLEVSPQEMHEVTHYLYKCRDQGGFPVAPMEFECTLTSPTREKLDPQTRVGCDGAVAYCTITSTGDVLPCNFFSGVEAENVKEHSFAWIWENSRFLNYFRSLMVSDIHEVCQGCAWLSSCRGSCIAANFAHGDIFQPNRHCWLATEKTSTRHVEELQIEDSHD